VTTTFATAELRAASDRFKGFFDELGRTFVEREELLAQIALALLGREHVLMTGPPGTAKSGVARAVLGRIVDERTGEPSVFARQFTESTVQTDLVGPLDFKTLMQTGHTEHFTDEGMLGAVHAFLDEVLDGRDMLLRTTLNVLEERELKQGSKTTRGRIECALMTTNRYLAEVLEGSRETLLAFVDRIAFVSFVPKGFAASGSLDKVLVSQVGGARGRSLKATLTIQDLDVLQAAVDRTLVPDPVCTALGILIRYLDADLASAEKNDPSFVPTRYLSTRTAVRLARILRAVCVYDTVMNGAARELVVEGRDLGMLRLSLLLCGPQRSEIDALLERETDPRERRQLSILRTERDIFDRALARVPALREPTGKGKKPTAASEQSVAALEKALEVAKAAPTSKPLLEAAAKLAEAADAGGPSAPAAKDMLAQTLADLAQRALRTGTTAGAGPEANSLDIVPQLSSLADGLEKASGSARPVARWLRGKATQILLDAASLSAALVGESLDAELPADQTIEDVAKQADKALSHLEHIAEWVAKLRAEGADEPAPLGFQTAIDVSIARVEDELVEIWDTGFRDTVSAALGRVKSEELSALLGAFAPTLARLDAFGARLARLGGKPESLKGRVVGPRIEPLVQAAFERVDGRDRVALVDQIGRLVGELEGSGLKGVVAPGALLRMATVSLVRSERAKQALPKARRDYSGYRALRSADQRVSLAYTVVELALRVAPQRPSPSASPAEIVSALAGLVGTLPPDLRAAVVELDLGRIERPLELLEDWWRELSQATTSATATNDVARIGAALSVLAESRFFHVTRDEGAFLRFALEARVVGDVFPEAADRLAAQRSRLEALEADSSRVLNTLRRGRADAGWVELLGAPSKRP
jgi:MoxR-like ATPase